MLRYMRGMVMGLHKFNAKNYAQEFLVIICSLLLVCPPTVATRLGHSMFHYCGNGKYIATDLAVEYHVGKLMDIVTKLDNINIASLQKFVYCERRSARVLALACYLKSWQMCFPQHRTL